MRNLTIVLAGVLFAWTLNACSEVEAVAKVGAPAPAFTLKDTEGTSRALGALKGKYVVLEWLNHDCPYVRRHYDSGNMQALQKELGAKGIVWLSINSSAPGKQGHFPPARAAELTREKKAAPAAVLLDHNGAVGRLYGARTTPHMFLINPEGLLIYQGAIDDRATTEWKTLADVSGAKNYVRQAIGEAMAGKQVSESSTKAYGCSVKY